MIAPNQKQKLVVIVGPTAIGKTSLSIALAKAINGEVISADSRQVYRGLDIGSGKVTTGEMDGVPHYLLDVADPQDVFTAADFVTLGTEAIASVGARGHVPVVIGGTGFYVDALVGRVQLPNVPPNEKLRSALRNKTLEELQDMLKEKDAAAYTRMDTENPHRLVRAIEIADALGTVPELTPQESPYDILWIGLTLPIDTLRERIQARLLARLDQGMLDEAKQLHKDGLSYERMEELGLEYRYMARYLSGDLSYDDMVSQLETETGKYAKRQMVWFKRNEEITWYSPDQTDDVITKVIAWLK